MQGDNKNQSLVDKGWGQMSSILDKEMPVEKDRRRPFLWWFFGVAALLLVSFTGYVILDSDKNGAATDQEVPVAGLVNTKSANNQEDKKTDFSPSPSDNLSSEESQIKSSPAKAETGSINSIPEINISKQASSANEDGIQASLSDKVETAKVIQDQDRVEESTESSKDNEIQDENNLTPDESELSEVKASLSTASSELTNAPARESFSYKSLSALDIMSLEKNESNFDYEPLNTPKELKSNSRKIDYRVYGGGLTETRSPFLGGLAGIGVELPLSSKFSINAGLEYNYLNRSEIGTGRNEDRAVQYNTGGIFVGNPLSNIPPLVGNNTFTEVNDLVFEEQIQDLHYIAMPIGVEYRFHPRWGVNAGFAVAYLASSRLSEAFTVDLQSDDESMDTNEFYQVNTDSRDGLNLWDFQFDTGIRFYVSRRIDISFNYRHGLTSVVGNPNNRADLSSPANRVVELAGQPRRDYNRFLSLEVGYRF